MPKKPYDHYKSVPELPGKKVAKKRKPKFIAVVDEDNCSGCHTCISFCPSFCIAPVAKNQYHIPRPPVQVRFNDCIGCRACARACNKLAWDAIRIMPTTVFEEFYHIKID